VFVRSNCSSFKTCSSNDLPPSETPRTRSGNTGVGLADDLRNEIAVNDCSVENSAAKRKYSTKDLLPKPAGGDQKSVSVSHNIQMTSDKSSTKRKRKRKREVENENYDEEEEDSQEQGDNMYDTAGVVRSYDFANNDPRPFYGNLTKETCKHFGLGISCSGLVVAMPNQTTQQKEKLLEAELQASAISKKEVRSR
jgi:hypothetical protein